MSINTDFVIATRGGAEHEYVMAITGLMFAPGGMVIKSGNRLNRAVISRKQFDSEPMRDVLPGEIDVNQIRIGGRYSVHKELGWFCAS